VIRPHRPPWWALAVVVPLVVAACGSGGGQGQGAGGASSDAKLKTAGATVQRQIAAYRAATQRCTGASSPVVCIETADRTLGGQVHTYANLLAVGKGFTAPAGLLTSARNEAQTLANSLEILGDAQPTQSNYDQVLNTFNLDGAIAQLRKDVQTLDRALGG